MKLHDCCIIGGGITGITAARYLHNKGKRTLILDKGRGRGGRLATRRLGDQPGSKAVFDYGAQFIQFESPAAVEIGKALISNGIVREWIPPRDTGRSELIRPGIPIYIGTEGIRKIADFLSADLDYLNERKAVLLQRHADYWEIGCENGERYTARTLLLTPPVYQSMELLHSSGIEIESEIESKLRSITYEKCVALLAVLKSDSEIYDKEALLLNGTELIGIFDNKAKGISSLPSVTILAGHETSERLWHSDDDTIAGEIIESASAYCGLQVGRYKIHKWKYSRPSNFTDEKYLEIGGKPPVYLAGDAFGSPNISGAAQSGTDAAEQIYSDL